MRVDLELPRGAATAKSWLFRASLIIRLWNGGDLIRKWFWKKHLPQMSGCSSHNFITSSIVVSAISSFK